MATGEFLLYLSPSQQKDNVGVLNYGTEMDNMHELGNMVKNLIESYTDRITVYISQKGMTLSQVVYDTNQKVYRPSKQNNSLHLEIHSNALSGAIQNVAYGTEAFWHYRTPTGSISPSIAQNLVANVGAIYGKRSAKPDSDLYSTGLYMLRNAAAPSALVEVMFHDNPNDVNRYLQSKSSTAQAIVKSIFDVWGVEIPNTNPPTIEMDYKAIIDYCSNYEKAWYNFIDRVSKDTNYPEGKNLPVLIERIWNRQKA